MQILLIGDEGELVSTLAEGLSVRGIDADWVTGGENALIKIEEKSYDIAVVDIKVSKMGGLELKRKMARKCPQMKFIFMTGGATVEKSLVALLSGAVDIIEKPLDIETLVSKIKNALTRKMIKV